MVFLFQFSLLVGKGFLDIDICNDFKNRNAKQASENRLFQLVGPL